MVVYLAVLLSVLQGISMRGAKILVSLSALAGGATPFQVGVLAAMFAAFPLLLAVYAGKFSDRVGVKRPILGGAVIIALGILAPLALPGLAGLMVASALIGLGHIFFHVSIHNLVGAYGSGEARTRNFATFALGASVSAFIGPSLGGISIDAWGFRAPSRSCPRCCSSRAPRSSRRTRRLRRATPADRSRCCATRASGAPS